MSTYLEGCPDCVATTNIPLTVRPTRTGVLAVYRCSCGHEWATSWMTEPEGPRP